MTMLPIIDKRLPFIFLQGLRFPKFILSSLHILSDGSSQDEDLLFVDLICDGKDAILDHMTQPQGTSTNTNTNT